MSKENGRKFNLITKQTTPAKENSRELQKKQTLKTINGSISRLFSPPKPAKPPSKVTEKDLVFSIKMTPEEFNTLQASKNMYRTSKKVKM